jgi:hypothetical protein
MANANVARGLIPYAMLWGQKYNGSFNTYFVPASYGTALYVGDPVDIVSSSDANGIPAVQLGVVGSPAPRRRHRHHQRRRHGRMTAVTRDLPVYHPASTAQLSCGLRRSEHSL